MKTKQQIRKDVLQKRKALTPEEVSSTTAAVLKVFTKNTSKFCDGKYANVALYFPIFGEIDTRLFFAYFQKEKKICLFPKCESERLDFYQVSQLSDLTPGFLGIPEPKGTSKKIIPDLVLVPGLAFTKSCHRIGYGKGYYDQTLRSFDPDKTSTVGLAHEFQIIADFPVEPTDVALDFVISEKNLYLR